MDKEPKLNPDPSNIILWSVVILITATAVLALIGELKEMIIR